MVEQASAGLSHLATTKQNSSFSARQCVEATFSSRSSFEKSFREEKEKIAHRGVAFHEERTAPVPLDFQSPGRGGETSIGF